ncbi:DUTP diphosphatase [Bacillus wiedmannii]|uniref:dUTP diphosphatase n=1 Tax=Bacillus wiedmannii TaxID=1890302 RepID=A0A1C4FJC6_9BACI|nr:DUTP diphosphatase [Bacillus wiedmannii]
MVDDTERYTGADMKAHVIERGTRIAPVETAHFVEVDELLESERGNRGFGSTGVK